MMFSSKIFGRKIIILIFINIYFLYKTKKIQKGNKNYKKPIFVTILLLFMAKKYILELIYEQLYFEKRE